MLQGVSCGFVGQRLISNAGASNGHVESRYAWWLLSAISVVPRARRFGFLRIRVLMTNKCYSRWIREPRVYVAVPVSLNGLGGSLGIKVQPRG